MAKDGILQTVNMKQSGGKQILSGDVNLSVVSENSDEVGYQAERLQKIMAVRNVASRRAAEKMIVDGRVTVNGQVAMLGDKADPEIDEILLDGKPLG